MNLNPMGGYDSHSVVHSAGSQARARETAHRRTIQGLRLEPTRAAGGFMSRLLASLRPDATPRPACFLADGRMGRLALQRVDGAWVEVCIPA